MVVTISEIVNLDRILECNRDFSSIDLSRTVPTSDLSLTGICVCDVEMYTLVSCEIFTSEQL